MKNLRKALIVAFACTTLFSCSKKMQAFQFGNQPYLPTTSQTATTNETNNIEASTKTDIISSQPVNEAVNVATNAVSKAKVSVEKTKVAEKPTFKQKIAQKIIAKKIQKLEKGGGLDANMKLGIVIAAVSLLVLIITAAGLLGGISGLFWLLGGLGLLTGLIIILLVALEVI